MENKTVTVRQAVELLGSEAPQEIQILKPGTWNTITYGPITITADDLDQVVENFNSGIRKGVPINYDHDKKEAAAWFTELENRKDGDPDKQGVWSKAIEWTTAGAEKVMDEVYKFISPELDFIHQDMATGKEYKNVLVGAALTNYPLFKELQAIKASENGHENEKNVIYIEMPKKELKAGESLEDQLDMVADAFECWMLNPFRNSPYVISETNTDYIIVSVDTDWDGDYDTYRIGYKGNQFELPVKVETQYVPAASDQIMAVERAKTNIKAISNKTIMAKEIKDGKEEVVVEPVAPVVPVTPVAPVAPVAPVEPVAPVAPVVPVKVEASETVSISASELEQIKLQAIEGAAAMKKIQRMEASEKTHGWLFNEKTGGKFPLTSHDPLTDFVVGLNANQLEAFESIVEGMPNAKDLFTQLSAKEDEVATPSEQVDVASDQLVEKAEAIMADEKRKIKVTDFGTAMKIAIQENKDIAKMIKS